MINWLQVFGTFFSVLSHYLNTFKCKKSVSIFDRTDFDFYGLTKRNRVSIFATELTSLLSQLVERCTGIAEVLGSNHVKA